MGTDLENSVGLHCVGTIHQVGLMPTAFGKSQENQEQQLL